MAKPPFITKLWALLTPAQRRGALWLIPAEVTTALAQVIGVASVLPFLTLVADPQALSDNSVFQRIDSVLHFTGPQQVVIIAGVLSLTVLILSNLVAALTAYIENRYVWRLHQGLQVRLMGAYLNRRYEFFLDRNSSELGKNILEEVSFVVTGVVFPALQLLSNGLVALFIVAVLVAVDPVLGVGVLVTFGVLYAGTFLLVNRLLKRIGHARVEAGRGRFQSIREAFGAIKDVKAHGHENVFLRLFDRYSGKWATVTTQQHVVQQTPRFMLEIFAFGGIIGIVLYHVIRGQDISSILPTIGLYAFGSYRLMPSLHRVYEASAQLRGSLPALDILYNDAFDAGNSESEPAEPNAERIAIERELRFDRVSYTYPNAGQPALTHIEASFPAGAIIAVVGTTGAGKTTFIDLLLGLLPPTDGRILVDGKVLTRDEQAGWQASIGYVPQQIYLTDNSVAENIAFGVAPEAIDFERLRAAAHAAAILPFIEQELPNGFATVVGEQGTRLSGGQRQRIGIARALYRDPSVLVLDEATSALDSVTEDAVMSGIRHHFGQRLVIMVAHRLTTVRHCDQILVLGNGQLLASGTFDELLLTDPTFRALAQASAPLPA